MLPSLIYGDVELSSFCRSAAYIDAGLAGDCWKRCKSRDGCCCGGLDGPFVDPETDGVGWFDPVVSCSGEFFGMVVESVSYGAAYSSRVKDTLGGGVVGSRNFRARELTVRGWLVGSSECGIQYGLDWLNSVLDPRRCGDGCDAPDLEVFTCCDLGDEGKGRRVLKRVSPLGSVRELTSDSDYRCCRTQVEFKLAAESPYFFRDPVPLVSGVSVSGDVCPNWCCPNCNDDTIWPDCVVEEFQVRSVPLGQASGSCYCEPLFAVGECVEVPAGGLLTDFLSWSITAGTDLVNVSFSYYQKPSPGALSPLDDPGLYGCERVVRSTAALIPAGYTLEFDSACSALSLTDPAGESADIYGVGGSAAIELGCDGGWFCVQADSCNDLAGTTFDVSTITGSL